jgi:hypothetical protein
MKKISKISLLLLTAVMYFTSCTKYLDIVPDHIAKVEDLFTTKADALDALAKIYWYLPVLDNIHESPYLLGDEYVCTRGDYDFNSQTLIAQRVMRDLQSSGAPLLGIWSGTGGTGEGGVGKHYYVAMRHCDLVMENFDLVFDMTEAEKKEYRAQVKFLKAYFAFMLIKQYGPIVLPQYLETDETDPEKLFPPRVSIDESFDYVIDLMKEAIPDLRLKVTTGDYGQVDQTVAKSILARVLVFRASPFYNGNNDLYGSFRNIDGKHFFPQVYEKEKWKDAIDALDDAINTCHSVGIRLYNYSQPTYYDYDSAFLTTNPAKMQTYYTRRFILAEPWNTELIWGRSDYVDFDPNSNNVLSNACNIMLPDDPEYTGAGSTFPNEIQGSGQFLAASYQMLERYYTENGLPIEEDNTYAVDEKFRIDSVPADAVDYSKYVGLLQPNHKIVRLYLNREIRFYSDLIISGGYMRSHRYRVKTSMFQDKPGGRNTKSNPDMYLATGVGVQKMVHPESASWYAFMQVRFPFPFIRLADLHLMRAEAWNEYLKDDGGPDSRVWNDVDTIRRRAGIPTLEESWGRQKGIAKTLDYHKEHRGMQDIILRERAIEFAFEGIHYWDMVRYKKAINEFTRPITGWNPGAAKAEDFFMQSTVQSRRFPRSSYLWPLSVTEMNINSNLVNNPGWE